MRVSVNKCELSMEFFWFLVFAGFLEIFWVSVWLAVWIFRLLQRLKMTRVLSYWAQWSIQKIKAWICVFKAWIFTLNLKRVLKLWTFRFVLTHSAQNDKILVILSAAKYPHKTRRTDCEKRTDFAKATFKNQEFAFACLGDF